SSGGSSSGSSSSGGSSSGGSSTGGASSSGGASTGGSSTGGGQLPQTGPADSAVALGTLGGTVLLTGVAGTLWLTRRRRAAR
ncbi:LPXTG cell wall anchor domain-containing protein, partial [Streptomyces sp. URMC 124]|uniref:LPXTG cell wall anchor domain-containing protein n=1 Tax=Streptomyces sp. URMC 124 TaxID=3423405 RepID=UPI003F1DC9CA